MASVFKLRRNAVDVDFLQGLNSGWRTEQWIPRVAQITGNRMPPLVTETIDLLADATSHNALATDFQDLDNYRWLAREYIKDRTQQHPVWLHAKTDDETGERRALVHDIEMNWRSEEVDDHGEWITDRDTARIRANIVRGPFWEDTTANTKTSDTSMSILGGVYDYSGTDVAGDAPARINALTISTDANLGQAWLGFRSANKHGTLANFEPLWECEDGTGFTDTAVTTDATASPGGGGNTKQQCDFATTATWAPRVIWTLSDISANESDQYGRFVVLLRAKVAVGTTVEVKLGSGYIQSQVFNKIVQISNDDWAMYNLGYLDIPARDLHAFPTANYADSFDSNAYIYISARRTAGTTLDLDCIVLIPADELFIYVPDLYNINSGSNYYGVIAQAPENEWAAIMWEDAVTDNIQMISPVAVSGFGVPVGDGRMYGCFATRTSAENTYDDLYNASLSLIPRWYNLRGSE